ncbi:MAG: carbohydrate-binding domain-containing protein [Bacteroidaceae bacterium]|nr:carbohydrate-binding domain-containing protein [Bacteroidaceae bacterium]
MKNLFLTLLLLLAPCLLPLANAQEQVRVWKQGDSKRFTTSELTFENDGASLVVGDSVYAPLEIDSITVVHTVTVTFAGDTAYVNLGHAPNVTDTIKGAHVNIVSTNTKSELEFVVQGESTHGSLTYDGPLKCKFYLNGLNLTSDKGAAIDIKCGKRVDLILNEGTENVLADAAAGTQKAALYCKGHLEVSGSGSLTVTGNTKHGIATKEYMELKKSTGSITVKKAVSDAMHVGQYFLMSGGTLTISGQKGDGLQVETMTLDDDVTPNPDKENNGMMFIRGGKLNITVDEDVTKGIKVPGNLTVSGGEFTIVANGDGSRGIQVAGNMLVNEDNNTTLMQIRATGTTYEDEETEDEDRCMGIKVKGNLTVNAGTIQVANKGKYSYGIKVDGVYTKSANATVQANVKTN